jgi:hypothetical protein
MIYPYQQSWHLFSTPVHENLLSQQQTLVLCSSKQTNMKYVTVEDFIASFPHHILPTVHGDPDYQTIHAIRKLLQANARAIDTHLGGGALEIWDPLSQMLLTPWWTHQQNLGLHFG